MKVLFDTCVVVDILGKSRFFAPAFTAYDIALFKKMDVLLPTSSTTDIVYLLHARGFMTKAQAREVAVVLAEQFYLIDIAGADSVRAAKSNMTDYEDALIAYAALRHGVDFIITRNKKDFAESPVPALSPEEFIALYKPTCLHYEEVTW